MAITLNNLNYSDKIINMTYTFEDNKITSVIGASGSGKTLISYLIMGLVQPTSGSISVLGNIIDNKTKDFKYIRRKIGYVFQNPEEEFFTSTVKSEIEFGLKKNNYKLEKLENQVTTALQMVGLSKDYLPRNPYTLSGGEKEKLAIAIALSLNPEIIILDEPTIFLDDKSTFELIELIQKIKTKYKKTIIILSNDIDFINKISDNILLIKKGKISDSIKASQLIDIKDKLKKSKMEVPQIYEFIDQVNKYKNKILAYTSDIDELVKEIKNNV